MIIKKRLGRLAIAAGTYVAKRYATKENIDKATDFTTEQLLKGVTKLKEKGPVLKKPVDFAKSTSNRLESSSKKKIRSLRAKSRESLHKRKMNKNPIQMGRLTSRLLDKALESQVVQTKREHFLREAFKEGPYLELALKVGPQEVYTLKTLKTKAEALIKEESTKEALFIFASELLQDDLNQEGSGFYQRLSYLLHMAQKISYFFGEEELEAFGEEDLSHYIALSYLAVMCDMKGAKDFFYAVRHHPELVTTSETKRVAALVGQKLSKNNMKKRTEKALKKLKAEDHHELQYLQVRPQLKRLLEAFLQEQKGLLKDKDVEEVREELLGTEE